MTKPQNNLIIAITATAILGIALIIGWIGKSAWDRTQAEKSLKLYIAQQDEAIDQSLQTILSTMLTQMAEHAKNYKAAKPQLAQLTEPTALVSADAINENTIALQQSAATLRSTMDQIMLQFEIADQHLKETLAPSATVEVEINTLHADKLAQWQAMVTPHIEDYTEFFEIEEELIETYIALMRVYQENGPVASLTPAAQQSISSLYEHIQILNKKHVARITGSTKPTKGQNPQ